MSLLTICNNCAKVLEQNHVGSSKRSQIRLKGLTVYRGDLTGWHPAAGDMRTNLDFCSAECLNKFVKALLKGDSKKGTSGKQEKQKQKTKTKRKAARRTG